ncbi:hypothetical protein [Methyloversatilis discipulorum]|uniref:hypothetical protein n=1 Tax=Methyloversatilis discipulorum TaxID=1119528 RepID=UPI003F3013ED
MSVRVRVRLADRLYARIASTPLSQAWRDVRHSGELQHWRCALRANEGKWFASILDVDSRSE